MGASVAGAMVLAVGALTAGGFAPQGALASKKPKGPKLQLVSEGLPVPKKTRSDVTDFTTGPGFTCEGFTRAFPGGPGLKVNFTAPGNPFAPFFCTTETGKEVLVTGPDPEGRMSKLNKVTVTQESIVEKYTPAAQFDDGSGCVWQLRSLEGSFSVPGALTAVPVSGTLTLVNEFSEPTCPASATMSGTVTIERSEPSAAYSVEEVK